MRKVFLDDLPKRGKVVDWMSSPGFVAKFIYDDIEGEIKIVDYLNDGKLVVEYNGKVFYDKPIRADKLKEAKLAIYLNGYKGVYVKNSDLKIKKIIDDKYNGFLYIGGYTGIDGKIKLRCKCCGYTFERSSQFLKSSNKKNVICKNCIEIDKQKKQLVVCVLSLIKLHRNSEIKRIKIKAIEKEKEKRNNEIKECSECGDLYKRNTGKGKFCSSKCSIRFYGRKKQLHNKFKGCEIDYSITLQKLHKRDNGVCYICGEECDIEDKEIRENGVIVCGNRYPSIEHVIPASKGGNHTWNNVKLAHRLCNSIKGSTIIENT